MENNYLSKKKPNHGCIDLIGKYKMTPKKGGSMYTMKNKKNHDVNVQAGTIMYFYSDWIEISYVVEEKHI